MSEIEGPKISVNQVNYSGIKMQPAETEQPLPQEPEKPQLKDFSDSKAETIGRSLLFKGADDVNGDLKAIIDNPQIAENSDEMFELAYSVAQNTGMQNPYEEAASASTASF